VEERTLANGRVQQVDFLPLAIATMQGEARCVAGLDVNAGSWVRPVVRGYRCLFQEQVAQFKPDHIHRLALGGSQPRSPDEDPLGYHTEDRPLVEIGRRSGPITPALKIQILERTCDSDLAQVIKSGSRSLFAVQPETFSYREDDAAGARFLFSSSLPVTRHTGGRRCTLEEQRIAVGSAGPKCTCPRWLEFARARWAGRSVNEDLLRRSFPDARMYLVVSLSALYEDYYWLIVAAVHVVQEDKTWL